MPAVLDHTDPRLGLHAAPAALNDPLTRAAIRLLGDTLGQIGDGLLAAPALGMPVRVIAMRQGDLTGFFLNPVLASLGAMDLSIGETNPHTGILRRNVLRARSLTLHGVDLSGATQKSELKDALAVQAQQAFDLLDSRVPLSWLTPFHRAALSETDPQRRALLAAVNTGLYSAQPRGVSQDQALKGLQFAKGNTVMVHSDGNGTAHASIDALDPMRPTLARHRSVLALMAALHRPKHALFADPGQIGLTLAALMMFRTMTAYGASLPTAWPTQAIKQLGIGAALHCHDINVATPTPRAAKVPALDAIVIDQIGTAATLPNKTALRNMARRISGDAGALLLVLDTLDADLEDQLQAAFPAVYLVEPAQDHVIYAALKTPLDHGVAQARLVRQANLTGQVDMLDLLHAPWTHLRKDGQRDRL